jgi:hypothetical protein
MNQENRHSLQAQNLAVIQICKMQAKVDLLGSQYERALYQLVLNYNTAKNQRWNGKSERILSINFVHCSTAYYVVNL